MRKNILIHIPHSSMLIPEGYRNTSLISNDKLDEENLLMCDRMLDEFFDDKSQCIIFPYSRLYCDVERFRNEDEVMNKYGMGYIYTKTSLGEEMFNPSLEHIKEIDKIYDNHHKILDERVSDILEKYHECIIIDFHSYSSEVVSRLFNYEDVPDICIGVQEGYYSEEITNYFVSYFENNCYSVKINYPYSGSLVPNKYYGKSDTSIISIMIEVNKRVYLEDFERFKNIFLKSLEF